MFNCKMIKKFKSIKSSCIPIFHTIGYAPRGDFSLEKIFFFIDFTNIGVELFDDYEREYGFPMNRQWDFDPIPIINNKDR